MRACSGCGTEWSDESRFCSNCGAPIAASLLEATATHRPDPLTPLHAAGGESRFTAGQILAGRYRIVNRIGKGGMGEVYRADDLRLGQSVALKFLPADSVSVSKSLVQLHEEVRLTRQISHANVCRVYDIGEAQGHTFLSMEYIDGEDLASLLRRIGRLPPDKGLEIARQLCLGLAAAHAQGVIHRDLKPANIMLDGRGHVRIMDFGLARVAAQVVGPEAGAGTPTYMAPEQLAGKEATVRSDLYALGLVLYEILTGKKAYQASSPAELLRMQESSAPASPSSHVAGLDAAVERVILRCLEWDPPKRPASALAVLVALPGGDPLAAALAAGETPSPEMVAAASDSAAWSPRTALAVLVGTMAALTACVLLYEHGMLVGRVGMPESPEELTHKARAILKKLDIKPRKDNAIGFDHDRAYLEWIRKNDTTPERWHRLADARPAALYFWYRHSDEYLVPNLYCPYAGTLEAGRITLDEPAPVLPGMTSLKLDLQGRLLELHAVPQIKQASAAHKKMSNWNALFDAAELDISLFKETTPEWVPPSFANERKAWLGTLPDGAQLPIRVEAATLDGAPVFFQIVGPGTAERGSAGGFEGSLDRDGDIMSAICFAAVLISAALLAPRSWRQGRADSKGALRLGSGSFVILMIVWLFETHHVPSIEELRLLILGLAYALYWAGLLWMTYIALEPYVRQLWPESLISWTRLLAGQWRDPRLGRDLLLGVLVGALMQVIDLVGRTLPVALGATTPAPFFDWWIPNTHIKGYWVGNFLINVIYQQFPNGGKTTEFPRAALWPFVNVSGMIVP